MIMGAETECQKFIEWLEGKNPGIYFITTNAKRNEFEEYCRLQANMTRQRIQRISFNKGKIVNYIYMCEDEKYTEFFYFS